MNGSIHHRRRRRRRRRRQCRREIRSLFIMFGRPTRDVLSWFRDSALDFELKSCQTFLTPLSPIYRSFIYVCLTDGPARIFNVISLFFQGYSKPLGKREWTRRVTWEDRSTNYFFQNWKNICVRVRTPAACVTGEWFIHVAMPQGPCQTWEIYLVSIKATD